MRHDQALLGFSRNLTHLDGRVVSLERKGVTQPGFVQTIKGEGMPHFENPSLFGDLFVEYNVVLPTQLSTQTRQRVSSLFPSQIYTYSSSGLAEAFYGKSTRDRDEL